MPWFVAAVAYAVLFVYAAPKLTTEKIETARAEGIAAKEAEAETEFSDGSTALAEGGVQGAPPPIDPEDS